MLFTAAAVCFSHSARAESSRPNIVYILADDFGYGDLHSLNPNRSRIATPHLDQLASQSMIFTDAHSGSSVCTPTRYGLLTGRYAWRTRLQSGVFDGTDDPPLIAVNRLTVPGLLKRHGYATAAIGKWHLGFDSQRPANLTEATKPTGKGKKAETGLPVGSKIIDGPITRGFDYFWGCSNARTMSGLIENDAVIESLAPIDMLPRLERQAMNYIKQRADEAKSGKPFFLYLPLTSPHTPIVPTPEWQNRSGVGEYGDFVMQTDAVVGSVLKTLDEMGLTENTLVIFTADNGCSPAAKTDQLEKLGHFASGEFRGYKADIWEGGHHVPFLVRWPNKVKAGSSCRQVMCHTDLLATCADLLEDHLPDNAGEDSVSFLPALFGKDTGPLREAVVHHSIQGKFAIRQGKWKLAFCSGSGGWAEPKDAAATAQNLPAKQLYDLSSDIGEQKNLAEEHPEVVQQLTKLLHQYVSDGRSTPGEKQANDVKIDILKVGRKDKVKAD